MKKQYKKMQSYLDVYKREIKPRLEEIDILAKGNFEETDTKQLAFLLDLTEDNLKEMMQIQKVDVINRATLAHIMYNADSLICNLFKRELQCGSPNLYSVNHISYIYNLDYNEVEKAFEFLNLTEVNSTQLLAVFAQINI